jgi:hypothetical protein
VCNHAFEILLRDSFWLLPPLLALLNEDWVGKCAELILVSQDNEFELLHK